MAMIKVIYYWLAGAQQEAQLRRLWKELGIKAQSVSCLHLHFLSPLEPGIKEIFMNFKKVMTVEINYSDNPGTALITEDNRRYAQLAWYLRAQTLVDIDCYSNVYGQPLGPGRILKMLENKLGLKLVEEI